MPARAPAALAPARLRTGLGLLGARWAWAARVDPTGLSVLEVWPRTAGSRWLGRPRACAYVPKAKFHLLVGQHHLYPNPRIRALRDDATFLRRVNASSLVSPGFSMEGGNLTVLANIHKDPMADAGLQSRPASIISKLYPRANRASANKTNKA